MSDIVLPNSIKFKQMEYISFAFQEASHASYESYYFVDTHTEEQPRIVLIDANDGHIELCFRPTTTIGIKNFELFYNVNDLVECAEHVKNGLRCIRCTDDHVPVWTEKHRFQNLQILECDNGHTKIILLNLELLKDWIKRGIIIKADTD